MGRPVGLRLRPDVCAPVAGPPILSVRPILADEVHEHVGLASLRMVPVTFPGAFPYLAVSRGPQSVKTAGCLPVGVGLGLRAEDQELQV